MGIFNASIFNNDIFNIGGANEVDVLHHGKGDEKRGKKTLSIYKPTGLPPELRQRVEDTRRIHEEVVSEVAKEFTEVPSVESMSLQEIEAEIGEILRKRLRTTDEEALLLLMLVAVAG